MSTKGQGSVRAPQMKQGILRSTIKRGPGVAYQGHKKWVRAFVPDQKRKCRYILGMFSQCQ